MEYFQCFSLVCGYFLSQMTLCNLKHLKTQNLFDLCVPNVRERVQLPVVRIKPITYVFLTYSNVLGGNSHLKKKIYKFSVIMNWRDFEYFKIILIFKLFWNFNQCIFDFKIDLDWIKNIWVYRYIFSIEIIVCLQFYFLSRLV